MKSLRNQNGFTLMELLVVSGIIAIIAAIAVANYIATRADAQYREAARSISSTLREARSRAISENQEYRVVFSMANSTYQLQRNNGGWQAVYGDVARVQPSVRLSAPSTCTDTTASADRTIEFNPNGTANELYICIMDGNTRKFRVGVNSSITGRVQITD